MKRLLVYLGLLLLVFGCRTIHEVPIEHQVVYEYKDSIRYVDSTVIIPVERVVDVARPYDTLSLETSMAEAKAWVDTTTHTLKGDLRNKQGVQYKYIYKDRIVTKDSLVYKDVPVPIELIKTKHPDYEPYLWVYILLTLFLFGYRIYRKYFHL